MNRPGTARAIVKQISAARITISIIRATARVIGISAVIAWIAFALIPVGIMVGAMFIALAVGAPP